MLWRSAIDDPIYTLNAFRYSNDKINLSGWENANYQILLQRADEECDPVRRLKLLSIAEQVLLEELPVVPLFDEKNHYIKNKNLSGIIEKHSDDVDFRYSFF